MAEQHQPAPVLFLDANIFIDILQERPGWQSSLAIVTETKAKRFRGSLSSLTVAIIHYIRKRQVPERQARQDIKSIIEGFDILAVTSDHVHASLSDESKKLFTDFEDALQFHSARGIAGAMITRNKRHYSRVTKEIQILTPEEFMRKYGI